MNKPRILFWYRKDLRIKNNQALLESFEISNSITSIYVFDQNYKLDFNSSSRSWFLGNSLKELSLNWLKIGSRLLFAEGDPIKIIPTIARLIEAKFVVWNESIEPYERNRDYVVEKDLKKLNIKVLKYWDNLLLKPEEISTGSNKPYTVYGPFYKKIKNHIPTFSENIQSLNKTLINIKLKDLEEKLKGLKEVKLSNLILENFLRNIDFKGKDICPCKPGEKAAEQLLYNFIESRKILNYDTGRNFPARHGTSFLSASLRFGTISIRHIWGKASDLCSTTTNREELISIETWQKELIWREFYQHCLYNFPTLEKGAYRAKWNKFPWQNNKEFFSRWSEGLTGVPIVDAAMRELNSTGWMHNRCRMIVASFLVKDLICNWQMGEKKFMDLLVDGDLSANNGGWQWSASSGMDPKPLRIFNPYTQTQKFDPLCKYIKYWIPELSKISNNDIATGTIAKLESTNYPSPLVSHNVQQRLFKKLYSEI